MRYTRMLLAVAAGLMLLTTAWAQTQQKQGMKGGNMMEQCKAMMELREKMQAEMRAMDADLDQLVTAMNAAPADKKADATAAVITKMAEQRKMMREKTEAMHISMMHHMMAHMQMDKDSMNECPMMKEMMQKKDETKKPGND